MIKMLQEQYFDCCDRLFLNYLAQKKVIKRCPIAEEQIEKDEKLKKELERFMFN